MTRELLGSCSGELLGSLFVVARKLPRCWPRVARELLGVVARASSQGFSGVEPGLLRSCSGVSRGDCLGDSREFSCSEVARELSQGCSGVDPRLFGSCSEELLGSCSGVAPGSCSGIARQSPTTLNLFSGISSLVCFVSPPTYFLASPNHFLVPELYFRPRRNGCPASLKYCPAPT